MKTNSVGHQHDRRWIEENLRTLPHRFQRPLVQRYERTYEKDGRRAANLFLLGIREHVGPTSWRMAANDDALRDWAGKRAESAGRIMKRAGDEETAYLYLCQFCEDCDINPERVTKVRTVAGAVARMCCELWWRRAVRKSQARKVESAAISLGLVHNRAGLYSSDETVERRRQQKTRNRKMLESLIAVNELGDSFTLQQLSDLSVSNPVIRRGELMVRMTGFEQWADSQEHVGDFYTWTCPSRMHWSSDKYDGTTPAAAQRYLCEQWAKARAAMKRAGVSVYGFRVAEPHHDGCPHWHMLFFMAAKDRATVRTILKGYALQVDGDEKGAAKHRFTVVPIDKSKGTAAGYLAKYVAKNIDAFGVDFVDEDLTGKRDPRECAARVDAWASAWGIRQFQQVGGPSVTVWRELRRLGDEVQPCAHLEQARAKADVGDWAGYIAAQSTGPVWLAKSCTGEVNRYGEVKAADIVGVQSSAIVKTTRVHEWRIDRDNRSTDFGFEKDQGNGGRGLPGDGGVRRGISGASDRGGIREKERARREFSGDCDGELGFLGSGAAATPWSPVNNCTEGNGNEFEAAVGSGQGYGQGLHKTQLAADPDQVVEPERVVDGYRSV